MCLHHNPIYLTSCEITHRPPKPIVSRMELEKHKKWIKVGKFSREVFDPFLVANLWRIVADLIITDVFSLFGNDDFEL